MISTNRYNRALAMVLLQGTFVSPSLHNSRSEEKQTFGRGVADNLDFNNPCDNKFKAVLINRPKKTIAASALLLLCLVAGITTGESSRAPVVNDNLMLDPTDVITPTRKTTVSTEGATITLPEFSIEIDGFYDKIYSGKVCHIINGRYSDDYSKSYIKDSPYNVSQSTELRRGTSNGMNISKIFSQWDQNQKLTSLELFEIIGIKTWGEKCSEFKCIKASCDEQGNRNGLASADNSITVGYRLDEALNLFREIQNNPSIELIKRVHDAIELIKRVHDAFTVIMTLKSLLTLTDLYDNICVNKAILNLEKIYMILFFQFEVIKCIKDKNCDLFDKMKDKYGENLNDALRNLGDYIGWNINKGLNTNNQTFFHIARCAYAHPQALQGLTDQ